jgi:hypothetical protein
VIAITKMRSDLNWPANRLIAAPADDILIRNSMQPPVCRVVTGGATQFAKHLTTGTLSLLPKSVQSCEAKSTPPHAILPAAILIGKNCPATNQ